MKKTQKLPTPTHMQGDRVVCLRPQSIYFNKTGVVDRIFWLDSTGWNVNVVFEDGTETPHFVLAAIFEPIVE